uniref:Transmembrane protein n=1 Tax=Ascaris lumbricoides TaxID=6252 RepID=A0A0M3IG32_ASCLU
MPWIPGDLLGALTNYYRLPPLLVLKLTTAGVVTVYVYWSLSRFEEDNAEMPWIPGDLLGALSGGMKSLGERNGHSGAPKFASKARKAHEN